MIVRVGAISLLAPLNSCFDLTYIKKKKNYIKSEFEFDLYLSYIIAACFSFLNSILNRWNNLLQFCH